MKAILVIDMPECCCGCDYCNEFGICKYVGNVQDAFYRGLRYIKCPLKPIPHKREAIGILNDYERGKILGFNSCLKIILGETE